MSLIPLQTLPGWPEAPAVTVPQMLLMFVGYPLAIALVFLVLTMFRAWTKSGSNSASESTSA